MSSNNDNQIVESEKAKFIRDVYTQNLKIPRMETTTLVATPVTFYTSWYVSQHGKRCDFFEKQWLDCASQVGKDGAKTKCKDEYDDLNECLYLNKTFKRYHRMQEERQRLRAPFQNPPPLDTHTSEYKLRTNFFV